MNKRILLIGILVVLLLAGGIYYDRRNVIAPSSLTLDTPTETATSTVNETPTTPSVPTKTSKPALNVQQTQTISITEANNNETITVKKDTSIVIALGTDIWTLSFAPATILSEIKNVGPIEGMQGLYSAKTVGTTVITAEGRPNCKPGEMCAQYIKNFMVTIKVTP